MVSRKRPSRPKCAFLEKLPAIAVFMAVLAAAGILYHFAAPEAGTITAYAVAPDQLADPQPVETVVRLNQPFQMWLPPLFYSVPPGLCFTFTFSDCEIDISVSQGHLYDMADGKLKTRGTQCRTASGNPVYWAPNERIPSVGGEVHADMEFTVYRRGNRIASGCIEIDQLPQDHSLFTAHPELTDSMRHGWYYDAELTEFSGGGYFTLSE